MAVTLTTNWKAIKEYVWEPGTGFKITFYLNAKYDSVKNSVENNESYIYTRLTSIVNAGQGSGYNYEFKCSYAPTVSGSGIWYLGNETITEGGKTPIKHNDDGTKTIRLEASARINGIGLNISFGEDVVLDTIPRATRIQNQIGTIGQVLDIKWTKASNLFTHTLSYSFGDIEDEILGENLVDGFKWEEIPEKLYQYFPNSPSKQGTLKITTFNGDRQIGTPQTATLTINANQSFSEPIIEDASIKDINSNTSSLTGDDTTFILNKSIGFLNLTFKTRNYAKIKSITIDNKNISTENLESVVDKNTQYGLEEEIGIITKNKFNIVITDTRDFSVSYEITLTDSVLINYVPLDISSTFKRIQPTTGEVGLTFDGKYYNGSFGATENELTINYKYKKKDEENYSDLVNLIKGTDYTIINNTYHSGNSEYKQQIKLEPLFDYRYVYEIQLFVKDKLTTLPTINVIIIRGIPIMWWNGEKVVVNGDLYIADKEGENPQNVLDKINGLVVDNLDSEATNQAPSIRAVLEGLAKLKPVVLFSGNTNGTVTLKDSSANYEYIEILYRDYDNHYNSVKIYQPNGKMALLYGGYINDSNYFGNMKIRKITISDTSITFNRGTEWYGSSSNPNNGIYITRVLGYK